MIFINRNIQSPSNFFKRVRTPNSLKPRFKRLHFGLAVTKNRLNITLKTFLLLWIASFPRIVPRGFNFVQIISSQDSLIDVGTGNNGKVLDFTIA